MKYFEYEMPFNEKISLSKAIEKLPGYMLEHVVHIICYGEAEDDWDADEINEIQEIEVDFLTLKLSTLRALEAYVAFCEIFLSNGIFQRITLINHSLYGCEVGADGWNSMDRVRTYILDFSPDGEGINGKQELEKKSAKQEDKKDGRDGPAFTTSSADKESDTSSLSSATDTSDSEPEK